jgi:MSHA biogenesis protein MshI
MENRTSFIDKFNLPRWLRPKASPVKKGQVSLGIDTHGFTLTFVCENNGIKQLQVCERFLCDKKNFPFVLSEVVHEYGLQGMPCTWILAKDYYQLFTLDELPVKPDEFQSAIRWNIKKLLTFPIEDAVIDSFYLPSLKISKPKKQITVVVARKSYLQPIVVFINNSGLHLHSINITELGLSHVTALYENDEMSTALIQLREQGSDIMITRQKEFYFTRHLDWGLDLVTNIPKKQTELFNMHLDKLALEIQRTFDYFLSQWRYPAPTRVLLTTAYDMNNSLVSPLSTRLALKVQILNLQDVITCKQKVPIEFHGKYLPSIGGALYKETTDAAN